MSTAVERVLQTEMMQLCLDVAFEAGALPREDIPKAKEIREVSLQEVAEETMDRLTDMAERSWAGYQAFKGTLARPLLGWNPTRLDKAWRQEFADVLKALQDWQGGNAFATSIRAA